jgi:hypothetical protein
MYTYVPGEAHSGAAATNATTAGDTLARRVIGAIDRAGSPGATFRARARRTTCGAVLGRPCLA